MEGRMAIHPSDRKIFAGYIDHVRSVGERLGDAAKSTKDKEWAQFLRFESVELTCTSDDVRDTLARM
jgi:hypothetical protein